MKKGKSRTRIARVNLIKSNAKRNARKNRSQARVRNLQKRDYSKQSYDGSEGAGGQV